MDPDASVPGDPAPSVFNYVLSFLLVGVAWGFTTPFIRRAAADFNARQEKLQQQQQARATSDRGRSQTQSPVESVSGSGEEEQELLPQYEPEAQGQEEGNNVRRRSGSRQRQGESEENLDDTPAPVWMQSSARQQSWLRAKIVSIFWTVVNLLRTPGYSIPLVINLTGSVWFFLLVGKHGMLLMKGRAVYDYDMLTY